MIQQTSIQSFQELSLKSTNKLQIVKNTIISLLLQHKKGLTDTEICSFFSKKGLFMKPRTRRNELMHRNIVYSNSKRECSITKKVVKVWRLCDV